METVGGMVRIFARSEEQNKLRYTTFIGDGDTTDVTTAFQDI